VKRAFANLIDNALTHGGCARVALSDDGASVRVTVDDDGPGIAPENVERMFQPFQRMDASRNRRTGGVGLGLAIVRQAIAREGGIVTLATREGGGLRAEVTLSRRGGGLARVRREEVTTGSAAPAAIHTLS
jgi:signal transduction histidine kinase